MGGFLQVEPQLASSQCSLSTHSHSTPGTLAKECCGPTSCILILKTPNPKDPNVNPKDLNPKDPNFYMPQILKTL